MSDIKQQIQDIFWEYQTEALDINEAISEILKLINENYVSKGRGKCGDCKHFAQYSDGKMKCSFYGSMPRNTMEYELCIVDNGDKYGFESKI
jgi:predicted metal-dependent peptidase